jgi:hypothetical protein
LLLANLAFGQTAKLNTIDPGPDIQGASLHFEFEEDSSFQDALPDGRVKLKIYVESLKPDAYRLVDVSSDPSNPEVAFAKPVVKTLSIKNEIEREGVPLYQSVFGVRLGILDVAKPRPYGVILTFKSLEGKLVVTSFELPVGAKDSGYIQVIPPKEVLVDAGGRRELTLQIINKYPEYSVRVFGYRVQCPDGLVAEQAFDPSKAKEPILVVKPGATGELRVGLHGEAMPAILNLEAQPKVNMALFYDDGFRVMQQLVPPIDLDFRLRFGAGIRLICALLGGLFGVWLRGFLPKGTTPLPGRKRPGPLSRYFTGVVLAALGWILSLGLGIEVLALGGRALASHATPFGSLMLGIGFGVLHPTKIAQFVEGLFSKTINSPGAQGAKP